MNKEFRSYNVQFRAVEDEQHGKYIEGVPIVYDQWSDLKYFDERIAKGALDNADLRDVRFFVNHNTESITLARSRNNNPDSTMQLTVEDDGLHIRANLDTENNVDARALYSAISRGDITGMSFAFTIDAQEWEDLESDHPKRTITRIKRVFEVSAVNYPAYEQTSISARADELDSFKAALDSARAEARAKEKQPTPLPRSYRADR